MKELLWNWRTTFFFVKTTIKLMNLIKKTLILKKNPK